MGDKGRRPKYSGIAKIVPYDEPPDYDKMRPIFCLEHLTSGFDLKNSDMTKDAKAAFAERLQELASLTWSEIKRQARHKQGFELLPVKQLKVTLPRIFDGEENVMCFRYHGMLPMAGIRRGATLHFVAIERTFGDLYNH
jgi:hypothetical protein